MRKLLITLALSLLIGGLPSAVMAHIPKDMNSAQANEFVGWECITLGNVAYQTGKRMLAGKTLDEAQLIIKEYAAVSGVDSLVEYLMDGIAVIIYETREVDRIGRPDGQSLDALGTMVFEECVEAHGYDLNKPEPTGDAREVKA